MNKPVYVTRPSLAPVSEFNKYLDAIWESGVMSHNGPLVQQLEAVSFAATLKALGLNILRSTRYKYDQKVAFAV